MRQKLLWSQVGDSGADSYGSCLADVQGTALKVIQAARWRSNALQLGGCLDRVHV